MPHRTETFWSDDRKKKLADLWLAGAISGEIAAIMHCSRNMVCGMAHRMKLTKKNRTFTALPVPVKKIRQVRERMPEFKTKADAFGAIQIERVH